MRRPSIRRGLTVVAIGILMSLLMSSIALASAVTTPPLSIESNLQGSTTVITFPDANLESVIRDTLGKPQGDITTEDLTRLTKINGFSKGITDLTNIQYCINLTYLDLRQNRITDISPLSSLTKLTILYLKDNRISDISPLTNLTNLIDLTLRQNQISDISSLAGLTGLKYLYLSENQISDISALSKLTSLTNLYLSNNLIGDVSPLKTLVNLEERRLDGNPIQKGLETLKDNPAVEQNGNQGVTPPEPWWEEWFWTIVWSIVAVVFVLGIAGGRQRRKKIRFIPGIFIEEDED